jgi:hypothetical protein
VALKKKLQALLISREHGASTWSCYIFLCFTVLVYFLQLLVVGCRQLGLDFLVIVTGHLTFWPSIFGCWRWWCVMVPGRRVSIVGCWLSA